MGAASTITTARRQLRIPRGKLEDDGPAHAVADDDRTRDARLRAQRSHVVGERADRVVLIGCVTLAVPAEVEREDAVGRPEVLELGREVGVVAGPAVYEDERWISRAGVRVEELHPVAFEERHHQPFPVGDSPRSSDRRAGSLLTVASYCSGWESGERRRASRRAPGQEGREGLTSDDSEDRERRRPRRRAGPRVADLAAGEVSREGAARRAQAVGTVRAPPRREVHEHRGPRRRVGRCLVLRGPADLRAEEVRRHPAERDARRRPGEVRPHGHDDDRGHLRRHASRVLRARGAHQGLRVELGRRLAAVPNVPPLLRPDVLRGERQGARARLRQGLQRLDGRGVVWAVARDKPAALPHAALGRRPRGRRDQAQRGAGRARVLLQRAPDPPQPAEHPHRSLGPGARHVQRHWRHAVHAHRFVVDRPQGVT